MTASEVSWRTAPADEFIVEKKNGYEVSIKWKIENFSVTAAKADKKIISPKFRCSDAEWNLYIFPNGMRKLKNVGQVLMFLNKIRSPTHEHNATFKFDVIDEHQNNVYNMFAMQNNCKGNQKMWLFCALNRSEILKKSSGMLPMDTLTISFDLTVMKNDSSVYVSTEDAKKKDQGLAKICKHCLKPLAGDFAALYNNPQFSDVILKLGLHKFPAHKVVLGTRSRVFAAMFERDMKENQTSTVELVNMKVATVQDLLQYIYCGVIPPLSPGDAIDLYVSANRYDLQELLKICRGIILENLSMNNVFEIAVVADLCGDRPLNAAVKSIMAKNMKELIKTEKWKMFSKQKPEISVKLLESILLTE